MTSRLLITGTDTGVGKTMVGCALGFAMKVRGLRTGVMKPVETGCSVQVGELQPDDAIALRASASAIHPLEIICPYRYRAPLAPAAAAEADGAPPPDPERIISLFERIAVESDVVIVEGAGGIAVPLTWDFNYADLAAALHLDVILVIANRLGCLNSTLLSIDYATRRSLRVAGYILNDTEPVSSAACRTNAASLKHLTEVPALGTVRYKEPLPLEIVKNVLRSFPPL
ncbi:MAG TPA: dethiobiotin synthase [Candidatus Binataceae bacterium]|jgi:dethiobiotin synthetase|nr:dethiobiotin synthase [Candidatus Binataceae bacterium]